MALLVSQLPIWLVLPTILTVWPKVVTLRTMNVTATAVACGQVPVVVEVFVVVTVGVVNVTVVVGEPLGVWLVGKAVTDTVE